MDMKTCPKCGECKRMDAFGVDRHASSGRYSHCRTCAAARTRENWANKPDGYRAAYRRNANLKNNYGITQDTYDLLLAEQGAVCAICKSPDSGARGKSFAVDHCHSTGKVRSLLCAPCNQALGSMRDDPARLRSAADYLEAHRWSCDHA